MMIPREHIQGIEAKCRLYGLDEQARSRIKRLWPTVAPRLDEDVDNILKGSANLPRVSETTVQHKDLNKKARGIHLKALLSGDLGIDYFESCRKTVELEATLRLDAVFAAPPETICCWRRSGRYAQTQIFARSLRRKRALVSQIIAFDVANAIALHREAAAQK